VNQPWGHAGTQPLEVMLALAVFRIGRGRFTLHLTWLITAAFVSSLP